MSTCPSCSEHKVVLEVGTLQHKHTTNQTAIVARLIIRSILMSVRVIGTRFKK